MPDWRNTQKRTTLAKFETLFADWSKYANSEGIDQYKLSEIRADLYKSFTELANCTADTNNSEKLPKFLKLNDNIVICPTDKSKNITIVSKYFCP